MPAPLWGVADVRLPSLAQGTLIAIVPGQVRRSHWCCTWAEIPADAGLTHASYIFCYARMHTLTHRCSRLRSTGCFRCLRAVSVFLLCATVGIAEYLCSRRTSTRASVCAQTSYCGEYNFTLSAKMHAGHCAILFHIHMLRCEVLGLITLVPHIRRRRETCHQNRPEAKNRRIHCACKHKGRSRVFTASEELLWVHRGPIINVLANSAAGTPTNGH